MYNRCFKFWLDKDNYIITHFTVFIPTTVQQKKTIIYKYMTFLLHVSPYNGHIQEDGYQRKE